METAFDAIWHRRALAGDGLAIARLAGELLDPLYHFCLYRVAGDRHLCEEVVQETLVVAIARLDRYDPARTGGDIFPWLTGLARNEVRRTLAREKRATSLDVLWQRMDQDLRKVFASLDSTPFSDEVLRRDETREMVNATMSQLPTQYRTALEAKYLQNRTVREIAAARRTTEKAIESLLTRARQAFRETFGALVRNLEMT